MMVTERVGGMMDRGFTSPATMPDYSAQWADYYRFVAPQPQPTYCHLTPGHWARSRKLRRLRPL